MCSDAVNTSAQAEQRVMLCSFGRSSVDVRGRPGPHHDKTSSDVKNAMFAFIRSGLGGMIHDSPRTIICDVGRARSKDIIE